MKDFIARVTALSLVVTLLACGAQPGPEQASVEPSGPGLPVASGSWLVGPRDAPKAGRIVVGLLLPKPTPRRLASLVPQDKLDAYLAEQHPDHENPIEFPVEGHWVRAAHRIWGAQASRLEKVRAWFQAELNVRVVFRELLADECDAVPVVLAENRGLSQGERTVLAAYRKAGGRVVRLASVKTATVSIQPLDLARRVIRAALKDSPKVRVLAQDPFDIQAVREGDDLLITVPLADTAVALMNGAGKQIAEGQETEPGTFRFRAPDPGLNPFATHVVATWAADGQTLRRAWPVATLVGTREREYFAGNNVHAGGVLAVRIHTRLRHDSMTPNPNQRGTVRLLRDDQVIATATYTTQADGWAHPRLKIPADVEPGAATLQLDDVDRTIQIVTGARLSVVTERPLYKQTDKVHVRVMAHRAGDGHPLGALQVVLKLGDMKRIVKTSAHGIASHVFELVDAKVGAASVTASTQRAKATARFRVKAFERPTFTVQSDTQELVLQPGETAPIKLQVDYVNGTPLIGGAVELKASGNAQVASPPTRTAADGSIAFDILAKSGSARGRVHVWVRDADGRRQGVSVSVRTPTTRVHLDAAALSDLVVGVPGRLRIVASEPGIVQVQIGKAVSQTVEIDASGQGEIAFLPQRTETPVRIRMPAHDASTVVPMVATAPDKGELVLALDRRSARVGDTLRATVLGADGPVLLDLWKDKTPVLTRTLHIKGGQASAEVVLDASLAGVLTAFVSRTGLHDNPRDTRRDASGTVLHPKVDWGVRRATVLVTRGRALQVKATPQADAYRPGARAAVDVDVRDHQGNPTGAVLGYWGVDRALLALAPMTEGYERVFDMGPGTDAGILAHALAIDAGGEPTATQVARLTRDGQAETVRAFPIHVRRTPTMQAAARSAQAGANRKQMDVLRAAYLAAWEQIPLTDLITNETIREVLQWLTRSGHLDPATLLDAWGTPLQLWSDKHAVELSWTSAGPDLRFGTADDLRHHWYPGELYQALPHRVRHFHAFVLANREDAEDQDEDVEEQETVTEEPVIKDEEIFDRVETDNDLPFEESFGETEGAMDAPFEGPPGAAPVTADLGVLLEGPSMNGTIGIGGGAGGAFSGRSGGSHTVMGGGTRRPQPTYVRRDFNPTLCFVPEAIVGPSGKTTLQIPLRDSMTTWQLRLVASAANGATGVGKGSIRVKQPIHATPWLAPHLTTGDVVDVPVAVRNEMGTAVTARVTLEASQHLHAITETLQTIEIAAGGTGRVTFRLRAQTAGRAQVQIDVDTGKAQDRQSRVIVVHRNARTVVANHSGAIASQALLDVAMATAGPGDVRVDLYPTPLTEVLSGFDGLIAAPHG